MEKKESFLTVKAMALKMGVSYKCLRDWWIKGYFPNPISMDGHGGGLRYRESFIDEWIEARERESKDERR